MWGSNPLPESNALTIRPRPLPLRLSQYPYLIAVFCLPPKSSEASHQEYDRTELLQLDMVVAQLRTAIVENIADSQARHYARQLLQLTMEYLHKISRNVVTRLRLAPGDEVPSRHILTQLTDYVVELRQYMNIKTSSVSRWGKTSSAGSATRDHRAVAFHMTEHQKELVQVWDELDLKVGCQFNSFYFESVKVHTRQH